MKNILQEVKKPSRMETVDNLLIIIKKQLLTNYS